MANERELDVLVFGATGFTGKLVAEYLATAARPDLRWALAGRNEAKLAGVRRDLAAIAPTLSELPLRVADAADEAALEALVTKTRVVCTTVGPYAKHGRALARACARRGTHYCDLTGEVPFIRASIDENDAPARGSGARIVHCCGFDSIPFDLGVHMLWDEARRRGESLRWAKSFAAAQKGGFSGGTFASMLNLMEEASRDRDVRRLLADRYALDPTPGHDGPDPGDLRGARFDRDLGAWTAPFLMAQVNTRVVRRSHALLGYGEGFHYDEAMSFSPGARGAALAAGVTVAMAGAFAAASFAPARRLLAERVLPKPGEGPSKAERDAGYFVVKILAETSAGARLSGRVEGHSDPGYGETAKMLGESALSLADDEERLPARFGVLTPASAMGMRLVERLRDAGMTFTVGS